jgi:hypothetical protein
MSELHNHPDRMHSHAGAPDHDHGAGAAFALHGHHTLVRLPADPFQADVLRGERQWWQGRIVDPDDKLDITEPGERTDAEWLDAADWAGDEL